jgi:mycobactin lysine-N-oxygenase
MDFDGVVITGSGTPFPHLPNANGRVFDGKSFWQQLPQIQSLLALDPDPSVVIIGAGGTGAAIAHWFIQNVKTIPISIIGREPTLYTRHAGYFEDRLFTDEEVWSALPAHMRDLFISRLTSGVVWDYVMRALTSSNVKYECFSVVGYKTLSRASGPGGMAELVAELTDAPDPGVRIFPSPVARLAAVVKKVLPATVFIDARGFDPLWFVQPLLRGALRAHLSASRQPLQSGVSDTLCVGGSSYRRLHIPRLASQQGPGASNLMALGWMADRILMEYISAADILARS